MIANATSRGRRAPLSVLLVALAAVSLLASAPARAVAAHHALGPLGISPSPRAVNTRAFAPPPGPLTYHGGPVLRHVDVHLVVWQPAGFSFPDGYLDEVERFLTDVATDSGRHTNAFSVAEQYTDGDGPELYSVSNAGAVTDANPLPADGCTNASTTHCLTQSQQAQELDRMISQNGDARGNGNIWVLVTPPGVGSCANGDFCAYSDYCAYHSAFDYGSGETLWANEPSVGPGIQLCEFGEEPNGTAADVEVSILSHELIEMATDPYGGSWFDSSLSGEIGDKCAWIYGDALGFTGPGEYNQLVNGDQYELQEQWSNLDGGCVQSYANQPPTAAFTPPHAAQATVPASFDTSASSDPDGTVAGYQWDFGDGSTGTGATPSHTYATEGSYAATLTVTDDDDAADQTSEQVDVAAAPPPPQPQTQTQTQTQPQPQAPPVSNPLNRNGVSTTARCVNARASVQRLAAQLKTTRRALRHARTAARHRTLRRKLAALNRRYRTASRHARSLCTPI